MKSRFICWYSTPESREAGKVSVLALIEMILSVAAYWWIAIAFDTYIHLVASIVLAPLVLLRSEVSIKLGAEMFERYWIDSNPKKSTFVLIVLLSAACSGLVVWALAESWLMTHVGWALFWRAAVLGWLAINIGWAVALAVVKAVVVTGAVAVMGVGAGAGAAVLIRAVLIRFWATATHCFAGARALPTNWRDLMARTDALQPPELIPGLSRGHEFRFGNFVNNWGESIGNKILILILVPIIFVPSLLVSLQLEIHRLALLAAYLRRLFARQIAGRRRT